MAIVVVAILPGVAILPVLTVSAAVAVLETLDDTVLAPSAVLTAGMPLVDSALEVTNKVGDAEFRDVAVSSATPSSTTLVVVAAVVEKLLDDGVAAVAVVSHPLHVLSHLSPTLTHKPLAKIL